MKADRGTLPSEFAEWFAAQGWQPHPHQLELLASESSTTLLVAPTGGGKTLAGFLPSLIELSQRSGNGLHTLYVSPLKALAADIARNLARPVQELGLQLRIEDRTSDTRQSQRKRQRVDPPDILLTTPESLALMLSYPEASTIFSGLRRVVIDEVHALAENKRGDQLVLSLSRLSTLSPQMVRVALSATVENPSALADFVARAPGDHRVIYADPGPPPRVEMLATATPAPWLGQGGRYAAADVMAEIHQARTTLVFINTRAQAELFFQALWRENSQSLPIGIHHGSLSKAARKNIETAMTAGELRAVVCTGTLDLGIDWGDVDLVIQVGAPKNVKRLVQRIGRSNHRYDAPSRAILVPANRFEVLECIAALDAVRDLDLDGEPPAFAPRDVLCQHILLSACAGPFDAQSLFDEITTAGPFRTLSQDAFDECLEFCATGGYALRAYDRWQRLVKNRDGLWQLRDPRLAAKLRMNAGTIVDTETLGVRMRGQGHLLGEVEESFAASLSPGDTFLIGGKVVRYEGLKEMQVMVSPGGREPRVAVFSGSKFSTSTLLSQRIQGILEDREGWSRLPRPIRDWLEIQERISSLPRQNELLCEQFTRGDRAFLCVYSFAGRNANQTLGLLLTRAMEETGSEPIGFVANDYALLIWGLQAIDDPAALFDEEKLKAGLGGWIATNAVMKRTFRNVATIAGLIERNMPGLRKSGKQATFSSDILYDTLMKYDPDHLMLKITREEAMRGLVDFSRIQEMLQRVGARVRSVRAPHVTPLAAPLILEIGKVPVAGAGRERLAAEESAALMREAGLS